MRELAVDLRGAGPRDSTTRVTWERGVIMVFGLGEHGESSKCAFGQGSSLMQWAHK